MSADGQRVRERGWIRLPKAQAGAIAVAGLFATGCPGDSPAGGEGSSNATTTSDATSSGSEPAGTSTGDTDPPGAETSGDETSSDGMIPVTPPRLHELQALGTHNSYHVAPAAPIAPWAYTHRPLDEQLDIGVRQFELDVWRDEAAGDFAVYHVATLDANTTCAMLSECIATLAAWSDRHPHHHAIVVLIEPKDGVDARDADAWNGALEDVIAEHWPVDRLITPDRVIGTHASLRDAIETDGWPTIDALRGHALFVLHDAGTLRAAYVGSGTTGRLMFPDAKGDLAFDWAVFHSLNDPIGDADAIAEVVAAGHLVRTRADADNIEPNAGDTSRRDAALASGAHFISTDWPEPSPTGYVATIPDGTPSRCNPARALPDCTPTAIEDPTAL